MTRSLDHHVALCRVRLVGTWIKMRDVVAGARSIRSEKLRESIGRAEIEVRVGKLKNGKVAGRD